MLWIIIPLIVYLYLNGTKVKTKKKGHVIQAEENNESIGSLEEKLDRCEIDRIYRRNRFDAWIRCAYTNVKEYEVLEHNFYYRTSGKSFVRIYFWDGTRKDVRIAIDGEFQYRKLEDDYISPEEVTAMANKWMEEHVDFFLKKQETKEGFSFPKSEFPAQAYRVLIDKLSEIFIVQEEEDIVRFANPA